MGGGPVEYEPQKVTPTLRRWGTPGISIGIGVVSWIGLVIVKAVVKYEPAVNPEQRNGKAAGCFLLAGLFLLLAVIGFIVAIVGSFNKRNANRYWNLLALVINGTAPLLCFWSLN